MDINIKQKLGQFYTTNYDYILQNLYIPENIKKIIEPFAGNGDLLNFIKNKDNYRESKDIARKRISFTLVYEICNYLLFKDYL